MKISEFEPPTVPIVQGPSLGQFDYHENLEVVWTAKKEVPPTVSFDDKSWVEFDVRVKGYFTVNEKPCSFSLIALEQSGDLDNYYLRRGCK